MTFRHVGKCQRCGMDAGFLDGDRIHTVAGLIFSVKTYRDYNVFCESPIFEGEEF